MPDHPKKSYDGPPPWHLIGKHGVFPEASHDETARFNFIANLNRHLAAAVGPGNQLAYERRVLPAFKAAEGRPPKSRHEIRRAMLKDPIHQTWSALRRTAMEMRQQNGRSLVLRQIDDLNAKAHHYNDGKATLKLDPALKLPRYVEAIDHHCMPGSYHTELVADDVSAGANYDTGLFVTTGGMLGTLSDGGGQAVAQWVKNHHPDFKPERILDVGCTVGHNAVPLAQAFPEAEVIAIDVGAPVLRYAHARAQSLGVTNITFQQMSAEKLDFPDNHFDWVQTTMFLHETSRGSMERMLKEFFRVLRPGGLMLHVEQPRYSADMPLYEQFIRDWDAFGNNEPFWSTMHEIDIDALIIKAGFAADKRFDIGIRAVTDPALFPEAKSDVAEDHGRAAIWNAYGAWK